MAAGLLALPFGTAHAAETPVYDTSQAALAQSQLRDVTGRVTDRATGDPIVGVTVANNSTGSGTVTDTAGAFTVKAATGQLLTISCVGYTSWTVKVPASGAIDVELSEDAQQLDDVVVVGYATQKKINVTGAVSSISGEELAQRPVVSTMQALQGIDPSLNISIDSGNPTAGNSLNIRGVPSINGGSPLILVDGVPGVSLRLVNAADIESISVLKDASASAIYGAKASAGVILVTTKKGAAGKATVSYSNNIGWTQPTTPTDFITNGYDYATIVNDLYFSRYAYNAFNYTDADWAALEARRYDTTEHPDRPWVVIGDDGKYHYYGNFDWYHSIYNTNRFHQEHNLSLSGGGKDVNYYVSGRYYQQDGVLGGNMIRNKENYKNYSFRAKFDAQLFKWAKWSTNASLNAVNQKYPGPLNEAQTIAALEENVAPMFVPYNPDGSIVMYPADLRNVAALPSPLGRILDRTVRPNGMEIRKVSVPFGVVGVIYEARPNVGFDVFALCVKSGNACILKGGSDARDSNAAIAALIRRTLAAHGFDENTLALLPPTHEATAALLGATGLVDLVIPRGGRGLIDFVRDHARVPVIETGAGVCHAYFDRSGDTEKGAAIVLNAKTRRVSVCNALDTLVVHRDRLTDLPRLCRPLAEKGVELQADEAARTALHGNYPAALLRAADTASFGTEFLSLRLSIRTVVSLDEALAHIARYSSQHSETIIAEDAEAIRTFQREVDAACVYANVSTAFTDGAQFGMGAEIGISTQKLHARGPMALREILFSGN